MSNGVNKVILIGNITKDSEIRMAGSTEFASTSIAVTKSWEDQSGEKKEATTFIPLQAFGKIASVFQQYVLKGTKLYVEGRLDLRSVKQDDGTYKNYSSVVVENFNFLGGKKEESSSNKDDNWSGQF